MKAVMVLMLLAAFCQPLIVRAEETDDLKYFNLNKEGIAVSGYDPVSYFVGEPMVGKSEIAYLHNGVQYRFASRENLERFMADIDVFLPAYGGWCAWAMLDGEKVEIDPMRFKIVDGVNYLFYDGFWGNTLKKWNRRAEKETEKVLIERAEAHWQKITLE